MEEEGGDYYYTEGDDYYDSYAYWISKSMEEILRLYYTYLNLSIKVFQQIE